MNGKKIETDSVTIGSNFNNFLQQFQKNFLKTLKALQLLKNFLITNKYTVFF